MVKLSSDPLSWLAYALFLAGAPLLSGIVNKLKARLSGRFRPDHIPALFRSAAARAQRDRLQHQRRIHFPPGAGDRLVHGRVRGAASAAGTTRLPVSFPGEIILFAYVLALGRFFQILAALDVASSFEGNGRKPRGAFRRLRRTDLLLHHRQPGDRHAALFV